MRKFELKSNIPNLTAALRRRAAALVDTTANTVRFEAIAPMSGPKSGRIYRRGSRTHQASAPGEAPAIDYGVLANSIQVERESDLRQTVFTNTEYAVYLEFGTSRMSPRPFFGPAFEAARPIFEAGIRELLKA